MTNLPERIAQDVDMVRSGYRWRDRYSTGSRQEEVRMVLLRRVIGDALRARRQGQHRTLREVSTAANVSLGYLSEIERGQKEASSELLASICDALGAQLSDVLRQVSDTLAMAEEMDQVLAPVGAPADAAAGDRAGEAARAERVPATQAPAERVPATAAAAQAQAERVPTDRVAVHAIRLPRPMKPVGIGPSQRSQPMKPVGIGPSQRSQPVRQVGGDVTVSVRHETPLRTTLKATRPRHADDREREIVYA
jgi:transcriptional regulator with XRE-family HTH domain